MGDIVTPKPFFSQTLAQFKKNNVLCIAKETNVLVR